MSKSCCKEALNNEQKKTPWLDKYRPYFPAAFSFTLLLSGIILEQINPEFFKKELQLLVYGIAYYAAERKGFEPSEHFKIFLS